MNVIIETSSQFLICFQIRAVLIGPSTASKRYSQYSIFGERVSFRPPGPYSTMDTVMRRRLSDVALRLPFEKYCYGSTVHTFPFHQWLRNIGFGGGNHPVMCYDTLLTFQKKAGWAPTLTLVQQAPQTRSFELPSVLLREAV
jgi:hypothetical protein